MPDSIDLPLLVLHEDEHLLVINKPAGWNTHAPSPFAGEGAYDWLRNRESRWATLAIIHRLDKETSGVLVFSKTSLANRALTQQFAERTVRKRYLMVTDRPVTWKQLTVKSALVRVGDRYLSRPLHAGAEVAETRFRVLSSVNAEYSSLTTGAAGPAFPISSQISRNWTFIEAEPFTGRTHQIRVHAAASGFPIRGDGVYGGTPAVRLNLYAQELSLHHPATGQFVSFRTPPSFQIDSEPSVELRDAVISPNSTNAYRLVHGAADGWAEWYVDRLDDYALSQSAHGLSAAQTLKLQEIMSSLSLKAAYHKTRTRDLRRIQATQAVAKLVVGPKAPDEFAIRENSMRFGLSLHEGYSVGLFLDQRDNRRRILVNHVAAHFPVFEIEPQRCDVLNAFAYTCGFSVCAAKAGARVTSLDLSRKYLAWGKRNFLRNQLDPAGHDFIQGDVLDWLRRMAKKQRAFDVVILDPPSFSQSKEHGTFQVERDLGRLVKAALKVLKARGVLFVSTNAASLKPEIFLKGIENAIGAEGRRILRQHYAPQPPDFPIARNEPGYLKTVWIRVL